MNPNPSNSSLLDRLMEAFVERQRRGERPSVEEYARQYPELADEIRDVFPALEVMEEFGSAAGPDTGPYQPEAGGHAAPHGRLGEFRILRLIGRGGMGVVYEAMQESLGRHVALKVLPPQARANPVYQERFRREAQAAARLHHTNIVPVFAVGEDRGIAYYAMQYIRGQTLDGVLGELHRFRRGDGASLSTPGPASEAARGLLTGHFEPGPGPDGGPVTGEAESRAGGGRAADSQTSLDPSLWGQAPFFRNIAELGVRVAEALAYAHGQGVLHRDVKPANLMLDLGGAVWVTDFGLAKAEGSADLTSPGDILGTLRYMAPEQLGGAADARSDVYSLGATLYELATLRPAFDDPAKARLIERIRQQEPTPPRRVEPQVPRDLETIILKAMAKEPGHRYQAAAEVAEDLRRFVEDRPIRARPVGRLERGWRWCRRNRALAAALAAVALTLLCGSALATYLALLAGGRADAADRNARAAEAAAEDARRSEEAAKASELRALAGEQKAKDALDEAERTLVDSLLRPIGHEGGPLGALELAALEKLAGLSGESVRVRFLRTGLDDAESARRLGFRAEPVARAVVGLDRQRKRAAEGVLLERLRRPGQPRDRVVACLALAAALRCEDESLADLGAQRLVELANRPNFIVRERASPGGMVRQAVTFIDQGDLERVVAAADGLTGGLSPARAGAHAEALLAALNEKSDENRARDRATDVSDEARLVHLATVLQSVLKRLPPDQAAGHASAAVTAILTTARRRAVTGRTVTGNGRGVERVDYSRRARVIAGLAPWISGEPAEAQARAVLAEMRKTAVGPDGRVLLTNKLHAVRWLVTALRALLPALPGDRAERHAAEAAGLLLAVRDGGAAWGTRPDLADGARDLAPYLPADAAARLADALGERLAKATETREVLALGGALNALLDRLPAGQVGDRADKAAEALVTALTAAVEKPAPAAPERPFGGPGRRFGFDAPRGADPVVPLATQLNLLLRRLGPERAGEHATRAATVLIPAFLEWQRADGRLAAPGEVPPLFPAIQAVSEHLPAREAQRHVEPWLTKAPTNPLNNGPLLVGALAERLPTDALLAALDAPLRPAETRKKVTAVLQRRAETMSGEAADQLFGGILARRRGEDVRGALKVLAGRVSADQAPGHADRLLARISGTSSRGELLVLTETFDALLSRLPPERAAELVAKATAAVVRGAARAESPGAGGKPRPRVGDLDEPLRALARRLPPAQAGRHVEDLLNAMGKARQPDDLCNGARGVLILADRLPPADGKNAVARAVQLLLPALSQSSSAPELANIATTLELVGDRFPVRTGDEQARAAMRLVEKTKRDLELPPLAEAYRVVLAGLPDGGAAPHAEAFAGHVVRAAEKTRSPLDLVALAQALRAIGRYLPPDSNHAEALVRLLFKRWEEAPEEILTEQIGEAVRAVAAVLPAGPAGPAADHVLAVLSKAGARDRRALVAVHEALIGRLPDDQARPRRAAALRACLQGEALGRAPRPGWGTRLNPTARAVPPAYLQPLVTACAPGDLIDVLGSPTSTGDVQGWLLAELGRRSGREFRSIWDLPPAR